MVEKIIKFRNNLSAKYRAINGSSKNNAKPLSNQSRKEKIMTTQTLEIKVNRIVKLNNDQATKAFADITVNGALLIKGVKVIEAKNGLFVSMPQDLGKDNRWYESVRCLNKDVREEITSVVLSAYKSA